MSWRDTPIEVALRRLAAEMAPELVEQAVADSRRDAVEMMRSKLTASMVEQMELLLGDRIAGRSPAAPQPAPAVAGTGSRSAGGWYVYGLTWEHAARSLDITGGIDDAPIETVSAGALAAVVSAIPTTEQWGLGADGDIELDRLAPRARKHEWVLEQMLEHGAVLPMRFGLLYPSLDRVREVVMDRAESLAEALRHLENQSEWGLTISVGGDDGGGAISVLPSADGRDYLARRRAERLAADERASETRRAAARIHDALLEVATEAVVHPAGGSDRRRDQAVLRASYLVPVDAQDSFRAAAEATLSAAPAELRLTGDMTGPWPAYHFCDVSMEQVPA